MAVIYSTQRILTGLPEGVHDYLKIQSTVITIL